MEIKSSVIYLVFGSADLHVWGLQKAGGKSYIDLETFFQQEKLIIEFHYPRAF